MRKTLKMLLESRKAWAGFFAVLGVVCATYLRAIDKIPSDTVLPLILGFAGVSSAYMASVATEDNGKRRANGARNADSARDKGDTAPDEPRV